MTRIAMWSGPRNISTALMRSWDSRTDTFVTDEPLYAHYLERTGLEHPGREVTLAAHETDWRRITEWLSGPVPHGKPVWYQKHMAHHLFDDMEGDWLDALTHAFLVREPSAMLVSLSGFLPEPTLRDTGLPQQLSIFERVRERTGEVPPVVDGHDILKDPAGRLEALCGALGVAYDPAMTGWDPGLRETDGAWAPFWYDKVARTTGFGPPREDTVDVPAGLAPLYTECREIYEALSIYKI